MKKILILTLFLTILTIGAVSATDSEINNATYDEALSAPEADEATIDEISETLSANADDEETVENDVLSAEDENNEALAASDDENILGGYSSLKDRAVIYDTVNVNVGMMIRLNLYNYDHNDKEYGNLTITINGEEYYNKQLTRQFSHVSANNLDKKLNYGKYNVTFSYHSDYDSFTLNKTVDFTYSYDLYLYAQNNGVYAHVYLPQYATGNVNLMINNKTHKNLDLSLGDTFLLDFDGFVLGENKVSANYSGDSDLPSKQIDVKFKLSPVYNYPYLIIDGEDGYVSISVPKDAHGNFTLRLPDTDYVSTVEVVDGSATIKMPKFDGYKKFTLEFISGSKTFSTYFSARFTNSSTKIKAIATEEVNEGESVQLRLLNEHEGTVYINVEIDGESVIKYHYLIGQMDISFPDLSVGNHTIVIRTSDDYSSINYYKKFNINVKGNINVEENGGSTPKPIDNPADASLNNTGSSPNNNANSNGNNQVSNKISLSLKTAKVKKSAKKLVLQTTLKINGKAAKSKTVTFKFNGKTYKAKTNSKGVAKLTIKKSVLKNLKVGKNVKYQVVYSNKLVKKTATVKK